MVSITGKRNIKNHTSHQSGRGGGDLGLHVPFLLGEVRTPHGGGDLVHERIHRFVGHQLLERGWVDVAETPKALPPHVSPAATAHRERLSKTTTLKKENLWREGGGANDSQEHNHHSHQLNQTGMKQDKKR